MAYIRPATKEEIVKWLLDRGYAEEKEGYGHVSAEKLANELMKDFDLVGEFRNLPD